MKNKLTNFPVYILILPLFFCLHANVEHFGFISFYDSFILFFQIIIASCLLFLICYLLTKKKLFSGIITFFITGSYCFFGDIKDNIDSISPLVGRYSIILPSFVLFTIILILLIRKKTLLVPSITLYINILLIAYCAFDIFILIFKSLKKEEKTDKNFVGFNVSAVYDKPNVYYLLFDEYAGYKNLQDSFNFKNDKLYIYLKQNNFQELNTFSNYAMTHFCMSSIFNMQYVKMPDDTNHLNFNDIQMRNKEVDHAQVFDLFKKMGYTIKNFSCFNIDNQKSLESNSFVLGDLQLLTHKMLHNRMLKDLKSLFLFGKFEINFFRDSYNDENIKYNFSVEKGLINNLNSKKNSPQFVYTHFFIPHSPVLFDSIGQRIPDKLISKNALIPAFTKKLYLSYLKYGNSKIISIVDEITKKDSLAIIVVMSDHGYRDWENRNQMQIFNFNNICFIRNKNKITPFLNTQFSNVNFFRYFFNENFNQSIPYLKDSIGLSFFH